MAVKIRLKRMGAKKAPFLVFNKWFDDTQTLFLEWLKSVLGDNFSELTEIENSLKSKGEN